MGLLYRSGQAAPEIFHFSAQKREVLWTRVKEELYSWNGTKNRILDGSLVILKSIRVQ